MAPPPRLPRALVLAVLLVAATVTHAWRLPSSHQPSRAGSRRIAPRAPQPPRQAGPGQALGRAGQRTRRHIWPTPEEEEEMEWPRPLEREAEEIRKKDPSFGRCGLAWVNGLAPEHTAGRGVSHVSHVSLSFSHTHTPRPTHARRTAPQRAARGRRRRTTGRGTRRSWWTGSRRRSATSPPSGTDLCALSQASFVIGLGWVDFVGGWSVFNTCITPHPPTHPH